MTFHIRRATSADLESLVSFAVAEAKEAEGVKKDSERVRQGVTTALNDDSVAMYWVLEKKTAASSEVSRSSKNGATGIRAITGGFKTCISCLNFAAKD